MALKSSIGAKLVALIVSNVERRIFLKRSRSREAKSQTISQAGGQTDFAGLAWRMVVGSKNKVGADRGKVFISSRRGRIWKSWARHEIMQKFLACEEILSGS